MGMIHNQNVPSPLHLEIKAKADAAGISVADYLLRGADPKDRLTLEEVLERLSKLPRIELSESPADVIREMRGPI